MQRYHTVTIVCNWPNLPLDGRQLETALSQNGFLVMVWLHYSGDDELSGGALSLRKSRNRHKDTMKNLLAIVLLSICHVALAQDINAMKEKCAEYGFLSGSEGNAACVQKLESELRNREERQRAQACVKLRNEADYWCSDKPSRNGMNSLGAIRCGEKRAQVERECS
jgi:hypothetical protein